MAARGSNRLILGLFAAALLGLEQAPALGDERPPSVAGRGSEPEQAGSASVEPSAPTLLVGPRIGGLVPFSQAGVSYDLGLELGAQFALEQQLGVVVEVSYRRPTRSIHGSDPRLPGGSYTVNLADPELAVFAGPRFLLNPGGTIVPFAAIGLGLHFLRTEVDGSASSSRFGETDERSTQIGLGGRAGTGLRIGPGLLTGALALDLAPLDHFTTGESRSSALSLTFGYLFAF